MAFRAITMSDPRAAILEVADDFESYLKSQESPKGQWISVDQPTGPVVATGEGQPTHRPSNYTSKAYAFSTIHGRWTRKGEPLVCQDEILGCLFASMRNQRVWTIPFLVKTHVKRTGIRTKDVKALVRIWQDHSLDLVDRRNDSLWAGSEVIGNLGSSLTLI